jgi:hypothetical protein
MPELKDPRLMYLKAWLFLIAGPRRRCWNPDRTALAANRLSPGGRRLVVLQAVLLSVLRD